MASLLTRGRRRGERGERESKHSFLPLAINFLLNDYSGEPNEQNGNLPQPNDMIYLRTFVFG